jgi:ribosome maturation factor RimP
MSVDSKIQEIVNRAIENTDFKVVDVEIKSSHGHITIRAFLDSENGITIDQCRELSRIIGDRLELENVIDGEYVLEVSSPGVDRPIREDWQFRKNIGRDVLLQIKNADNTVTEYKGKIESLTGEILGLCVKGKKKEQDQLHEFLLSTIQSARIQLKW